LKTREIGFASAEFDFTAAEPILKLINRLQTVQRGLKLGAAPVFTTRKTPAKRTKRHHTTQSRRKDLSNRFQKCEITENLVELHKNLVIFAKSLWR